MQTKEEKKEYRKKYYQENKERILLQCKAYAKKNKVIISKRSRTYRENTSRGDRLIYAKEYYTNNIEKFKQYKEDNKEVIAQKSSDRWYKKIKYDVVGREKRLLRGKKYYQENKGKRKEYLLNNKECLKEKRKTRNNKIKSDPKFIKKRKIYLKEKTKNDIIFKTKKNLRGRHYMAIKNKFKKGSAVKDLGCSIEYFNKYIENQFTEGMTWENYGRKGWHYDHQIPFSIIDLKDREAVKHVLHYTNLQPMWWYDNISKGNRINRDF